MLDNEQALARHAELREELAALYERSRLAGPRAARRIERTISRLEAEAAAISYQDGGKPC